MPDIKIDRLSLDAYDAAVPALSDILEACVAAGASVNFIQPFTLADAEAFWRDNIRPDIASGERVLFTLALDGEVVGTVHVIFAWQPNQAHRAEISKLLVHPKARRQGLARMLMEAAEAAAVAAGRTLMTLDTRTGDAAVKLYAGLGYTGIGSIPDFARAPDKDVLEGSTFMYKRIA